MPDITSPPSRNAQGAYLSARGVLLSENYPMMLATGALLPTSQTAVYQLIGACAGDNVTGVAFVINTAAVGTAPTAVYAGLYDSAGTRLAVSANVASGSGSDVWTAAQPIKIPFSATYQIPTTGGYYVAFLQNGSWGTTQVQLGRIGGGVWQLGFQTGTTLVTQNTQTGQTTLPASASFTSGHGNQQLWVGLY